MRHVLLDEVVETDYGQFDLMWSDDFGFDGDFDRFFAGQVNGLVGAADPGGVYLHFGRRSGGSRLRLVSLEYEPPPAADIYPDVVEVSIEIPDAAELRWLAWAGMDGGPLDPLEPGPYRLRVSARGRDAGHSGEFSDEIVDDYLVELWPAPFAPDAIVRVGSENARYWHREIGGRR